jgi:polysaccharide deacetylase 2 family uncharacterized protein YibQ
MRSLTALVVICVFGLAGLTAWLAIEYRSPGPVDAGRQSPPAAVIALPAQPVAPEPASRKPGAETRLVYLDPKLVEDGRWGPLPRIGPKGRKPSQVYARPFHNPGKRPRVAIVVTGLGLDSDLTKSALKGLPGGVTLAFSAYAPGLYGWTEQARAGGHEILMQLPMDGHDVGRHDAGPKALRASLSPDANRERLHWALSRFVGYVGVMGARREALSERADAFAPVLDDVLGRGLLYLQPRPAAAQTPTAPARDGVAHVDLWLAPVLDPDAIDRRMRLAEALARGRGWVVAGVRAYPVTINAVRRWARALKDRDLALAPLTAVAVKAE